MTKNLLIVVSVLLVHTAAAHAQQSQSPATQDPGVAVDQAFPPGYAPPPGFSPPPTAPAQPAPPAPAAPRYGAPAYGAPPSYGAPPYGQPAYGPPYGVPPNRYPPPSYYYYPPPPPPPRQITDRPFTLGGGIGFGGLGFSDPVNGRHDAHNGMAYTLRLGFGLRPGLILLWDLEGTMVTREAMTTAQTANFAALQIFASRRFFFKGGFGIAQVFENDGPSVWGGAAMAGVGYELVQGWNWSLDLEATFTGARYHLNGRDENWYNWSLVNFAINFF